MKTKQIIITAILTIFVSSGTFAQDAPQRGQRHRNFTPTLNGTWQLCTLSPGQNGQPQLTLLPMLKIFGNDGSFQNIGIPSEGACFIEKHGFIEKTSDSTFVEKNRRMRRDSVSADPATIRYRFKGAMWLVLDYKAPGEDKITEELWMRVRPKGRRGAEAGADRPQRPKPDGQNRPNFRGQRDNTPRNQVNAFEEDDNSDF